MSRWDARLLRAGLASAASAPGALHRGPSLIHLLLGQYGERGTGDVAPDAADLVALLIDTPDDIRQLEDRVPLDPRVEVEIAFGPDLLRVHPGFSPEPVQEIQRLSDLAACIDSALLASSLRFGLADFLELALRLGDAQLAVQAPRWASPLADSPEAPVQLTDGEVGPTSIDLGGIVDHCSSPDRAAAALEWGRLSPTEAQQAAVDFPSTGRALIIKETGDSEYDLVPACLLLEACQIAACNLAEIAVESGPQVDQMRRAQVFRRLCIPFRENPRNAPLFGREPVHVARVLHDVSLVVGVATALGQVKFDQEVGELSSLLLSAAPGATLPSGITIPNNNKVVRLVVSAGAGPEGGCLLFSGTPPGVLISSIEDLEDISGDADDSDDLTLFLIDLARAVDEGALYSSVMEAWFVWKRQGKAFHRSSSSLAVIMPGFDAAEDRWTRAGQRTRALRAVHRAGLLERAEAREVKSMTDDDSGIMTAGCRLADGSECWKSSCDGPSISVGIVGPAFFTGDAGPALNLHSGLTRLVLGSVGAKLTSLASLDQEPLRILLTPAQGASSPLTLEGVHKHGWSLSVDDDSMLHTAASDRDAFHGLLCGVLADAAEEVRRLRQGGPGSRARQAFLAAAVAAGPHFGAGARVVEQTTVYLPPPARPHSSLIVDVERRVGARLKDNGVHPGTYSDGDAVKLVSTDIFPVCGDQLRAALAPFDREDLVIMAQIELERAGCAWDQARAKAHLDFEQPWRGAGWAEDAARAANEASRVRRSIETIVELALATPSSGRAPLARRDWRRILSIADHALTISLVSEAAYHSVIGLDLVVNDFFELSLNDREDRGRIDLLALKGAEMADQHTDTDNNVPDLFTQHRPRIDAALRDDLGFGLDTILQSLMFLQKLPVARQKPYERLTMEELRDELTQQLSVPAAEIERAVEHLVLDSSRLPDEFRPWNQYSQSVRLLSHPLIPIGDAVLVGPWTCGAALQAWLINLQEGRLPWPTQDTPKQSQTALREYLGARNLLLEDELHETLVTRGFKSKKRVKTASAIGLMKIEGEIDVITADLHRREILVLEAKDPALAYVPGQIARSAARLLDKQQKKKSAMESLEAKVKQVLAAPENVAAALGIDDGRPWSVRGVVVTRRPEPAAYSRPTPPFRFATLNDVVRFASSPTDRALGLPE